MTKRLVLFLLALVCVLALALAGNTLRQGSRQVSVPPAPPLEVDAAAAGAALTAAVRARTIGAGPGDDASAQAFDALQAHLRERYPRVHERLSREMVGGRSLLYVWRGSDASAKPFALMAHQDVVPVAPGTEGKWTRPPFDGVVQDGFVWGRGAWDDKGNLIAQLEAVERLLADGFQPRRSVYLVFGHDEETGGQQGAAQIAALLQQRGVRLDFVLDEGLLIADGILPGLAAPVALIGVGEKGYLSVQLSVDAAPGHSSMPPPPGSGAIAVLSAALQRLDARPLPGAIQGAARQMLETLAPEMSGFNRVALSNLWLFSPLVTGRLAKGPSTNALIRTTTALTVLEAGKKDNVLPGRAEATVNFRLLPGDTQDGVLAHVRAAVADERVAIRPLPGGSEPSNVSSTASTAYRLVERTVREIFPGVLVAPGLMIGGTDARHFSAVADQTLRFSPVRSTAEDLKRFHGTDERLSLDNLAELIRFYHRLVQQAAQ